MMTTNSKLIACIVVMISLFDTTSNAQDVASPNEKLGTSMTLQQLAQLKRPQDFKESPVLRLQLAAEPNPALKYRFWLPDHTLKPGSAQTRFYRALMMLHEFGGEAISKIEAITSDNASLPSTDELKKMLGPMEIIFQELHLMATCEDTRWDHRLRDLSGPNIYQYRMPDVQESRRLAQILKLKIKLQIATGDINGAVSSLQDGFRLAAFMGQDESVIQQLVGIAIAGVMLKEVEELMQSDNAPNFYWALATLPRPFVEVRKSLQFELGSIHRVLPSLEKAELASIDEQSWDAIWTEMWQDFQELGDNKSGLEWALLAAASVEPAKKRLLESGLDTETVEKMPPLRVVLIDASREVQRVSNNLEKCSLLPGVLGKQLSERETEVFDQWRAADRTSSAAAVIAELLFPAVNAAKTAIMRHEYAINRLMTVEAIRMHAAAHDGKLPETLQALTIVPALPNPFTGTDFDYKVERQGDVQTITLVGEGPSSITFMKELRFQFTNLSRTR